MKEKSKIRWECNKCHSIIQIGKDKSIKDYTCPCKNKEFTKLSEEYSKEEWEKARIDFAECYDRIREVIDYYMDMGEDELKIVAIWIMGTYFHDSFSSYPYLYFNAMKGSGKTRLLRLISLLAKGGGGQVQTGITESVLFRYPKGKTLVLDEVESIRDKNKSTLREYLNASYKKGGIVQRLRKVRDAKGEGFEVENFEPYKPIAMANIYGMEEVLGDRCISIILEKSNNPAKIKKAEDFEDNNITTQIKRTLRGNSVVSVVLLLQKTYIKNWNSYIHKKYNYTNNTNIINKYNNTNNTIYDNYMKNNDNKIDKIQQEMFEKIDESGIDGRNLELLLPLLITCKAVNKETFNDILKIGIKIMQRKKEEELTESKDVSLIDFVSKMEQKRFSYINSRELIISFKDFLGELNTEEWLNSKWLGNALKRLNLISEKRRCNTGVQYLLNVDKAKNKIKMFKEEDDD